jgi:hypothetical protein
MKPYTPEQEDEDEDEEDEHKTADDPIEDKNEKDTPDWHFIGAEKPPPLKQEDEEDETDPAQPKVVQILCSGKTM